MISFLSELAAITSVTFMLSMVMITACSILGTLWAIYVTWFTAEPKPRTYSCQLNYYPANMTAKQLIKQLRSSNQ